MNEKEKQILEILRKNPLIKQHEIANILGLTRSSVANYIMNLTQKGIIKGKGYVITEKDHIVVIGSSNMDVTGYSSNKLIFEDSNPGKIYCNPGGVGRNIADNLALLGNECHLVSVVGDDFYGHQLIEHNRKRGIFLDQFHIIKGESSSTYLSLMDKDGEMVTAINDMEIINKLNPTLLEKSKNLIQNSALLVLDCNLSEESLIWIFNNAGKTPIFVDTVSAFKANKIKNWLTHIHTLKPNRFEAEIISNITISKPNDMVKVANWFHDQGVSQIIISMGKEGVFYSIINGKNGWVKPIETDVVNVTGAGDALLAGIAHCYKKGDDLPDCVLFGQACASLTLESELTNNPNLSISNVQKKLELLK